MMFCDMAHHEVARLGFLCEEVKVHSAYNPVGICWVRGMLELPHSSLSSLKQNASVADRVRIRVDPSGSELNFKATVDSTLPVETFPASSALDSLFKLRSFKLKFRVGFSAQSSQHSTVWNKC